MPNSPVRDGSQSQGISSAAVRYTPGSSGLQARASTSTTSSGDITDQSIATPTSQPAVASQGIGTGNRASRPLLLLSCIERRGRPTTLHQEYVTDITDDRQLFHTLRKIYYSHRRKFESFWSLRTLHSIHFMKVRICARPSNPGIFRYDIWTGLFGAFCPRDLASMKPSQPLVNLNITTS